MCTCMRKVHSPGIERWCTRLVEMYITTWPKISGALSVIKISGVLISKSECSGLTVIRQYWNDANTQRLNIFAFRFFNGNTILAAISDMAQHKIATIGKSFFFLPDIFRPSTFHDGERAPKRQKNTARRAWWEPNQFFGPGRICGACNQEASTSPCLRSCCGISIRIWRAYRSTRKRVCIWTCSSCR